MSATQPCASLYLKRSLYVLFGLYGKVLDVVHVRAAKVRSTAFIVFRELAPATAALRALDGEAFYGLQLRVTYAKTPSHATIAHHEGPEAVYAIKLGLRSAADAASGSKSKLIVSSAQKNQLEALKKAKRGRDDGAAAEEEEEEDSEDGEGPEKKKGKTGEAEQDDGPDEQEEDDAMDEESDEDVPLSTAATSKYPAEASPSLFIEGLPAEVTGEMLLPLFQQSVHHTKSARTRISTNAVQLLTRPRYPGLSSVKLLPTPPGSGTNAGRAHAVYETVGQASTAKEALDQFLLAPQTPMSVSWMKKA
ncbi:BZ3500_MvSof-1268-A1-R1_Chr7-1g09438 [Microbotryum saponariae]|uniref:BZ3500_MvSof-1268-A1-R1_Chr7-1g09438 protein n=1 Tax=Microbotryum saponariae TaxID=289078 RepID=A0A2X0M318_9BASI|nr:BZ3501_MvSof-1269-A2-R1_Chr7-1g09143 [Microbotryum saponariae]SDA03445.1 BZ3500_MvSof-1268-A1-R1_Chr7-1g09438 [Microbotryum saponariae]